MKLEWLRIDRGLMKHHKSRLLARRVGTPLAFGYILNIWDWCIENAPDGRIDIKHAIEIVEMAAGWEGESGALIKAAVDVGFLEMDGEVIVVHDWTTGIGADVAKAQSEADRFRSLRAAKRGAQSGQPVRPDTAQRAHDVRPAGVERKSKNESKKVEEEEDQEHTPREAPAVGQDTSVCVSDESAPRPSGATDQAGLTLMAGEGRTPEAVPSSSRDAMRASAAPTAGSGPGPGATQRRVSIPQPTSSKHARPGSSWPQEVMQVFDAWADEFSPSAMISVELSDLITKAIETWGYSPDDVIHGLSGLKWHKDFYSKKTNSLRICLKSSEVLATGLDLWRTHQPKPAADPTVPTASSLPAPRPPEEVAAKRATLPRPSFARGPKVSDPSEVPAP